MLVYSFMVSCIAYTCEFNPTETNIHFMGKWLILFGIWGEAELIFGFVEKTKYFQGAEELFQGFWEINALS